MSCEKQFLAVWRNPYLQQEIFSKNRNSDSQMAAKTGNLQAFKFGVLTNYTHMTMDYAAMNGHLDVLKWLWENRSEGCSYRAFVYAIENGHLNTLKWLYENVELDDPTDYKAEFINIAAKDGHLYIVRWLFNRGFEPDSWAMDYAAMNGHLHILKFLHSKGCECTQWAIDSAAENGHLETVKWLISINAKYTTWATEKASTNGHLDIIKLLIDSGVECTKWSFYEAVIHGHLEIAKYIYHNTDIRKHIHKHDIIAELKTQDDIKACKMLQFIETEI